MRIKPVFHTLVATFFVFSMSDSAGGTSIGDPLVSRNAGEQPELGADSQPRYEATTVALPTEYAKKFGDMYSQEIVYQGAAGGILRLMYREYVNDLARHSDQQELTYDYDKDGGPLVINVKGARIEVLEAGNSGIKSKVQTGFEPR